MDSIANTRVIILPLGTATQYETVEIPHPRTLVPTTFLLNRQESSILELKLFNYCNPHQLRDKNLVTKDGHFLKSIILNDDKDGIVLSKLEILIATGFNVLYLIISFYERLINAIDNDSIDKIRLLNLQDLLELWENDETVFKNVPNEFFSVDNTELIKLVEELFDKFNEMDEIYYKLNLNKVLKFLDTKLQLVLQNFPQSIYKELILHKLSKSLDESVPENVISAAKVHHSINLISSYISPVLQEKLTKLHSFEIEPLAEYEKQLQSIRQAKFALQDNLDQLNSNLKIEKRKPLTQQNTTLKKKKIVNKVPIGKGALDNFFKRN